MKELTIEWLESNAACDSGKQWFLSQMGVCDQL